MPQRCSLQALDALASDQCVAVDAHETVTEFIFKGFEGLIEQHLAAFVAQGHVLVVGDKIDHLIQRDQLNALSGTGTDVAARATATLGSGTSQGGELATVGPFGFFQRVM
ncbi:hypothetical protein D3C81_1981640 [compost metagenome]